MMMMTMMNILTSALCFLLCLFIYSSLSISISFLHYLTIHYHQHHNMRLHLITETVSIPPKYLASRVGTALTTANGNREQAIAILETMDTMNMVPSQDSSAIAAVSANKSVWEVDGYNHEGHPKYRDKVEGTIYTFHPRYPHQLVINALTASNGDVFVAQEMMDMQMIHDIDDGGLGLSSLTSTMRKSF